MENRIDNDTRVKALPVWLPVNAKFNTDMKEDSPFIVTRDMGRSDLGLCVMSTKYPRIVARYRSFQTAVEINHKSEETNERVQNKADIRRIEYIRQRELANENGKEAAARGVSVREYVEDILGRVYDEEFDEPRLIAKVPGLNVYLECFGCMDALDGEIDWERIQTTLDRMATWFPSFYTHRDRKAYGSSVYDMQPIAEWEEDYRPDLFPTIYQRRGIGHKYIDASRRPDEQHIKTNKDMAGFSMDKVKVDTDIRRRRAALNAQGYKDDEVSDDFEV